MSQAALVYHQLNDLVENTLCPKDQEVCRGMEFCPYSKQVCDVKIYSRSIK